MKKQILTIVCILTIVITHSQAQVIYEQDFESGGIPTGWTNQTNATDGGWKVGAAATLSSQFFTIADNGSAQIAATNDDGCNCDKSNEYFISPAIDLTNVSTVVLSFDSYFGDQTYSGATEDAKVMISTDATNWQLLEDLHGHASWDTHTVDISGFAGQTVYIGFRYDDGGGWLFGFGIDNFKVEVPPALEVSMAELSHVRYGEVGIEVPLKGIIYNAGLDVLTSMEIEYSVDGGSPSVETLTGLNIQPFSYYDFEFMNGWTPSVAGMYDIDVDILTVNGTTDSDPTDNSDGFSIEIFDPVVVPDLMDDFLSTVPVVNEVTIANQYLDKPTDLDFFPILGKDELWVTNQKIESSGGSTFIMEGASEDTPLNVEVKTDGNAWHFMSLPTGIAFSSDNFNFATSAGVQDANHNGSTFAGPALWSSDPDIYAQPSGGNGSHLDMLHGSPFSMGIAHEVDNVFWVYDDWNKEVVRYDFADDHGPGNDDHSDGIIRRYGGMGISAQGNIPNHLILDKQTGWLYFVDNGNDRVMRLDINSSTNFNSLPEINEPLAEHSSVIGFTFETIVDTGISNPCGIEIFGNRLLVGDYDNGDIVMYDMDNSFIELGRIQTGSPGLTGIKVGPDGDIWCTNRTDNTLMKITPGVTISNTNLEEVSFDLAPNPTSSFIQLTIPEMLLNDNPRVSLFNMQGQLIFSDDLTSSHMDLDLAAYPNGIYSLAVQGKSMYGVQKITLIH